MTQPPDLITGPAHGPLCSRAARRHVLPSIATSNVSFLQCSPTPGGDIGIHKPTIFFPSSLWKVDLVKQVPDTRFKSWVVSTGDIGKAKTVTYLGFW